MIGPVLFGVFFILVFLNVPIAVSLGLSTLIGLKYLNFSFGNFPSTVFTAINKFALLAIPFFILAGSIMDYAGISKRLIRFADVCIGHRKNGLLAVVVVVACFFAAISGSGPASVAALGGVLVPALAAAGYDKGLSTALISASGAIGIVIPPSIAYVVYASISDVSVGKLFMGGMIPGIIVGVCYFYAAAFASRNNHNIVNHPKATGKERWDAFKDAVWGIMMPVIILGGIYGGIFTPTEAAGVAVVYGLIVGILIYREIKVKQLWQLFVDAAVSSGTVLYIIASAAVFAYILSTSHLAENLSQAMLDISSNKYVLLILINIIFLIAGCFLDANSAFYILIPIMLPVVRAVGVDLVHFGVFVTVNLAIGLITPPVGINLYVGAKIADLPAGEVIRKIVPFLIAGIIGLAIITYIPPITLFLPNMMG